MKRLLSPVLDAIEGTFELLGDVVGLLALIIVCAGPILILWGAS